VNTRDDEIELTAQFRVWHGPFPSIPAIWGEPGSAPDDDDRDAEPPPDLAEDDTAQQAEETCPG
jgi:hypothetical protein